MMEDVPHLLKKFLIKSIKKGDILSQEVNELCFMATNEANFVIDKYPTFLYHAPDLNGKHLTQSPN